MLDDHRRACEEKCKYLEADVATARLNELKLLEEDRHRSALRSKHIAERVAVEETHKKEFQRFNSEWDQRMELFDQKANELEDEMLQRHIEVR